MSFESAAKLSFEFEEDAIIGHARLELTLERSR
jgi:hypothetical protein